MGAVRKKTLALVNPVAGGGKATSRAYAALERLRAAQYNLEVLETTGPGMATEKVRRAYDQGTRRFLAVGGDGTAFEVINGLFPQAWEDHETPTLGLLPAGTGNSFLKDFTTDGLDYSLNSILEERHRKCDVLRLIHASGTLHFINLMSLGFVSDVCQLRNQQFSRWGTAGYVLAVLISLARLKPYVLPIRVEGKPEGAPHRTFLSVTNSRFTGGNMMMAPQADTNDGKADLVSVSPLSRLGLFAAFPKIFRGTHLEMDSVTSTHVDAVDFDLDRELDVMIDGEMVRLLPKRVEVLPGALEVQV